MPMYDYKCERCEAQFEIRQSFQDDTLTECPAIAVAQECEAPGKGPVLKIFTNVGVVFKGEGFYKNDHGTNARGRQANEEAATQSDKTTTDDDKKTESKNNKNTSSDGSSSNDGSSSKSSKTDKSSTSNKATSTKHT